jgi:hydrogenase maturation factor HypF (carbamoyltransferase family)
MGGFRPFVYALAGKFGLSGSRVVDMPLGEQLPRIC